MGGEPREFKMSLSALTSKLSPVTSTAMEVLAYATEESTGLFIEGHTPDSKEWKEVVKKIQGAPKDQKLHMTKGGSYLEIKADKKEQSDADLILTGVMTGAYQLSGEKKASLNESDFNLLKINMLGEWGHVLDQWRTHLDDRKNFLQKPEAEPKTGSKA